MGRSFAVGVALSVAVAGWAVRAEQLPLAPIRDSGQTVTPVYEGWYENSDGTFTLSFGYYSRNATENVEIPIGENNFLDHGDPDQGQPDHFLPLRQRGVFTVTVPADFGDERVTWTISFRGETTAIPGHLHRDWMLDALEGEAAGNTPPVIKFAPAGSEGRGPRGIHADPLTATVGEPVTLTVWATDDGVIRPGTRPRRNDDGEIIEQPDVTVTWLEHQGPGDVEFSDAKPTVDETTDMAATTATFSVPGDYILRLRANDITGENPGQQCCWTNGYVKVTVTE